MIINIQYHIKPPNNDNADHRTRHRTRNRNRNVSTENADEGANAVINVRKYGKDTNKQ